LRKKGKFNLRNPKPEVDIDCFLTAFRTFRDALKYYVNNLSQVAPQVRVNWQSARSTILWVYMFEVDFLLCLSNGLAENFTVDGRDVPLATV